MAGAPQPSPAAGIALSKDIYLTHRHAPSCKWPISRWIGEHGPTPCLRVVLL